MIEPLDAYVRQQAYLEGYKNGEAEKSNSLFDEAAIILLLLLTKAGVATLSELPRRQLRSLIAEFNKRMAAKYSAFQKVTVAQLQKFMRVSVAMNRAIASVFTGKPTPTVAAPLLWGKINNAPVAGPGLTANKMLGDFFNSAKRMIERTITRGYADGLTPAEFIKTVTGTRANGFKDGIARKLKNEFASTIETLIQHVQQSVIAYVGSLVTDNYRWVSVIDSQTTDICRGRNGNVYAYSSGPRPPAHYRCRSTIVPVFEPVTGDAPPTFFTWVSNQPVPVQNDLLGRTRAVALRGGRMRAENLTRYTGASPLTLEEYAATNKRVLSNS